MNLKNTIFLSIWILLCTFNLQAQNELDNDNAEQISFIKRIGNGEISRGVTVEEISDGGYILTGYTTDGQYGGEDIFLIKTNIQGDTNWCKTYGGKGNDNGWAVRQTVDGGFIIVGFTDSFGKGRMDVFLIKTDSMGGAIWTKTFGGEGDDFGWDIRITKDNGFIIAAQTNSQGSGEIDAYLIKTDSMGNEEWSNTYGGEKADRIFSVQQTRDGGFIAGGITYSYTSIGPEDRDGYLIKTDPSGKQEWHKTFGKDGFDVVHCVELTNDEGFILTGYGESYALSENNRDVYLINTDVYGETQWIKAYGGLDEERGLKGQQTKDDGYVVIGYTNTNRNLYLLKTNSNGDHMWTRTFGENNEVNFGYTVKETRDGGYILTGHSENLENGQIKILLIKTNEEGIVD